MEVSILQHAKDKAPQRLTIDEVADRLVGNEAESGERKGAPDVFYASCVRVNC